MNGTNGTLKDGWVLNRKGRERGGFFVCSVWGKGGGGGYLAFSRGRGGGRCGNLWSGGAGACIDMGFARAFVVDGEGRRSLGEGWLCIFGC